MPGRNYFFRNRILLHTVCHVPFCGTNRNCFRWNSFQDFTKKTLAWLTNRRWDIFLPTFPANGLKKNYHEFFTTETRKTQRKEEKRRNKFRDHIEFSLTEFTVASKEHGVTYK